MTKWKRVAALTAGALAVIITAMAGAFVYSGWYDVSATRQHTAAAYRLIDLAARRSIRLRAEAVEPPELAGKQRQINGYRLFRAHCVQCHGAPGVAPAPFARGMTPVPSALVQTARRRSAGEIYWTIRHGIKMTGMPAWKYRLSEEETWDVVAFLRVLPALSPAAYQGWHDRYPEPPGGAARQASAAVQVQDMRLGRAGAGRQALQQYLCVTCHAIPGVVGAEGYVGPPLGGMAGRQYIAGTLPNTPANMVHWLRHPTRVKPQSAMPDLGVSEQDARDIAAFLYTLGDEK